MIKKNQIFFNATKILLTLFLCSHITIPKLYTMSSDNLYDALIFNKNSNILDICKTIISSYEFQEPCIPNDTFYTPEDFCDDFLNPIPLFPIKFVSELATEVNSLLQKKITQHTTKTSLTDLNDNNYGIYAQAMIVEQDAHVITIGDLHGNVHSLARIIKNLHQKNFISPEGRLSHSTYIIFTGDLADRGHFGVETWVIALLLKIQNPDNVIILQGNHEHKELTQLYGFHAEILAKYQKEEPAHAQYIAENLFPNLFKLLPQTCFIGAQSAIDNSIVFTQYMHAGLPMFKQSNNEFFNIT